VILDCAAIALGHEGQNHPMDDIVKQALIKWPQVPDCYGWLGLDRRGGWYLRDEATQAQGAFPQSKGVLLQHEKLIAFIGRNYEVDAQGQWYFQNGPQRVYVELECAPWILHVQSDLGLMSHTGRTATPLTCLTDENGWIYFLTDLGLGLVHSQDAGMVADAIDGGRWTPESTTTQDLCKLYRYVWSPKARQQGREA
jgi:hypothetical protein